MFGITNSFVVYVYSSRLQCDIPFVIWSQCNEIVGNQTDRFLLSAKVNNDHEETFEFIKEGFMSAFTAFLVSW